MMSANLFTRWENKSMKNKRAALGIAALLLALAAVFLAGKPAAESPDTELADSIPEPEGKPNAKSNGAVKLEPKVESKLLSNAPLATDFMMGDKNAPVTLIEYASLSCPHCAHFHNDVLPTLTKDYIEKGKLRYILRQFPLNEPAFAGAMLVTCVGEESGADRYYTFNRVLFDGQNKWAFDKDFKASLKTFAEVGGVSDKTFEACLTDSKRETRLLQSRKDAGEKLKIDSTPYLFLNGHPHKGGKSLKEIKQEIDHLLSNGK
jgi:protein-disulfide isomerase